MQQNNNGNRSFKIITAIALCVAVLCLSVAYASLSATLKVSGTATVEKASWGVELQKQDSLGYEVTGTGTTVSGLTIASNEIKGLQVNLKYPGAKAVIKLKAKNTGDIPAELSSITPATITCDSTDETSKTNVCGAAGNLSDSTYIKYQVTYAGEDVTNGSDSLSDKKLASTAEKNIVITITYDSDAVTSGTLPTQPVTISFSNIVFNYVQDTSAT